jgi:hypothetical protein
LDRIPVVPLSDRRPAIYQAPQPENTEPIPHLQIYRTAALALSPWIILSPWPIVWLLRPEWVSMMLFTLVGILPLLFVGYAGLLVAFAYLFARRRRLSLVLLLVLCGLSTGYGVITVKEVHVDPARRLNGLLERLQAASQKRPFPDGTKMGEGVGEGAVQFGNTKAVSPFRERQDPAVIKVVSEDYAIVLWFFQSSRFASPQRREDKCKRLGASLGKTTYLTTIASDVWRCTTVESSPDSVTGQPGVQRMFWDLAFLDREGRIYAQLVYPFPVERLASPDQLLSFFAYYRSPATPGTLSQ